MTASISAGVGAASAKAEAPAPRVFVKTGTIAAGVTASAAAAVAVIGPSAVLAVMLEPPDYHVPPDHDDPVAVGTEIGLALVVLFVGWKLVAGRLVRLPPT